jgi:hypothetical protein
MNMKRFMNKKVVAIGLAAGLTLGAAGAAFAYFTSTGQGTGTASTGTDTAFSVAVTNDTSNTLTPGGPSETIDFTVTNVSSGNQELNQVAIEIANTTGTSPNEVASSTPWSAQANSGLPACEAGDFTLGTAAAGATYTDTTGQPVNLAPTGVYHGSVTISLVNGTDAAPTNGATPGTGAGNQDNCESVSPPLFFAAS